MKTIDLKAITYADYLRKKGYFVTNKLTMSQKILVKSKKIALFAILSTIMYILLWIIWIVATHASNDELSYYWVNSYKDLARVHRLEACERVNPEATRDQILHCGTMMTIVTAIESDFMQSPRCRNYKNCTGIKGWQNGKYGFMKFDSVYAHNLYFAEKFWKYHYKKSLFTFVYGYKQTDGSYKYGWTYTQQSTYLQFVRSKYSIVYKEISKIY